jgi:hypothetical protein
MVVRWWRRRDDPHWRRSLFFNATGGSLSAIVFLIAALTKFTMGSWVALLAIGLIILASLRIRRHYDLVAEAASHRLIWQGCRVCHARRPAVWADDAFGSVLGARPSHPNGRIGVRRQPSCRELAVLMMRARPLPANDGDVRWGRGRARMPIPRDPH